jgi:paraquat-inducible protein B
MSQDDDIPAARSRSSRWPGWIWAVPIAAVAIVGWLAAKEFLLRGPEVTVTFGVTGGVKASDTKVKFQGRDVGHVTDVSLHDDLTAMDVTLQLDSALEKHLGSGTRFWIADASPSLSNLSSLTAIVSGPSIGIDPHPGGKQDHYRGLTSPPAIKHPEPGLSVTLASSLAGGVGSGTPVFYRDLQVGEVESRSLDKDGRGFTITAFVKAPFDRLVHSESRFWNAGAVQVATEGRRTGAAPAIRPGAVFRRHRV